MREFIDDNIIVMRVSGKLDHVGVGFIYGEGCGPVGVYISASCRFSADKNSSWSVPVDLPVFGSLVSC